MRKVPTAFSTEIPPPPRYTERQRGEAMGIYVDVLLALNFLVDYLLLFAAQLLSKRAPKRGRTALAALLGAVSSLIIFVPRLKAIVRWGYTLLTGAALCRAAASWLDWRSYARTLGAFLGLSLLYGGAMIALRLSTGGGWLLIANGVVYFHIPPLVLVGSCALGFAMVSLHQRLFPDMEPPRSCEVTLRVLGKTLRCQALLDTGNRLSEPFSGWPVVLLEGSLLPAEIPQTQLRLIPCKTATGGALLQAVKGESLSCGDWRCEQFYVALSQEKLQGCQLLLHQSLMNT